MAYKDPEKAKEYYRLYRQRNKQKRVAAAKKYYAENREAILKQKKEYSEKNRDKLLAYFDEYNKTKRPNKKEYYKKYYEQNKETLLTQKRIYAKQNKELISKRKKQDYERNKEKRLAQKKLYRESHKGQIAYLNALRKQVVKVRTPVWLSADEKWMIKQAYELAALRTVVCGYQWHVDHMIPLQGKRVSGLHVPNNLQVIPWISNIRKKNKYGVEHGWA